MLCGPGRTRSSRLRFKLDNNNNLVANYLTLYSGNAALTNQPLLIVEYMAP
jgi:hypothetical protein